MALDDTVPVMLDARQVDVVVVGAGLAGLVTTLELLDSADVRILLVDRCAPEEVGGLAREAFGGMFMVDTSEQRRSGIPDTVELAWQDWSGMAGFDEDDEWPRRWAEEYVARARDEVGGWLKWHGVRFFPVVNWAERGVYGDGNSVPRFHLTWGCGQGLVDGVWGAIQRHPRRSALEVRFGAHGDRLLTARCVHSGTITSRPATVVIAPAESAATSTSCAATGRPTWGRRRGAC